MTELYIYVDESGDLGYSEGASRYFVIGAIVTTDKKCVEKIPKRVRQRFMKRSKRNTPELKANKSNERIRAKVLEGLTKCKNTAVIWLWIDKKHTYPHVKKSAQNKAYHYNYLMGKIIDLIPSDMFRSTLNMTVFMDLYFKSKKVRRDELEKYLIKRVSWRNSRINFKVQQIDSSTNNGLQVVDFVSYALFRCLEYGDCKYYEIIEKSELIITKKQIY